jgi:hypothetical protein
MTFNKRPLRQSALVTLNEAQLTTAKWTVTMQSEAKISVRIMNVNGIVPVLIEIVDL